MGRRGIELEVKFAPAGEGTLADLAARVDFPGWDLVRRRDEAQENTYYDTADGALEGANCSLRRRLIDGGTGGTEWTFKRGRGPGRDGVARRRETNVLLARAARREVELPRVKPVERAQRVAGSRPLLPLFTLLTTRRQLDLARPGGTRVALALDRVTLADDPTYQETEIEIELLDGDEGPMAELALWLMRGYGLLPMRGSKRGRALSWRRGDGLPVVAPGLGIRLIAERLATIAARGGNRPPVVALAAPRGSGAARALAEGVLARVPQARLVTGRAGVGGVIAAEGGDGRAVGPILVEGPDALSETPADLRVWVKVSLARPLLVRLLDDAAAAGMDAWELLRRCGEYVVPLQRRTLAPPARPATLAVIDNDPPGADEGRYGTPVEQVKLFGWPGDAALAGAGARPAGHDRERDHFFRPPASRGDDLLRVRLRDDVAWVSFARPAGRPGVRAAETGPIEAHEARPRVLALLRGLGYGATGEVTKERRRYQLGGWEVTLDRVAGLGHFCELRRTGPDAREAADIAAALGLGGARTTAETYLALQREARAAETAPLDARPDLVTAAVSEQVAPNPAELVTVP